MFLYKLKPILVPLVDPNPFLIQKGDTKTQSSFTPEIFQNKPGLDSDTMSCFTDLASFFSSQTTRLVRFNRRHPGLLEPTLINS